MLAYNTCTEFVALTFEMNHYVMGNLLNMELSNRIVLVVPKISCYEEIVCTGHLIEIPGLYTMH